MDTGKKDTFFNATLLGIALFLVAQGVMSGYIESQMPRQEPAAAARASA
jgi:hypothetical protein